MSDEERERQHWENLKAWSQGKPDPFPETEAALPFVQEETKSKGNARSNGSAFPTAKRRADFKKFANIPACLKELPQWVVWRLVPDRDGRPTKVLFRPRDSRVKASSTDPSTWTNFTIAQAMFNLDYSLAGIGFCFTADDPFTFTDIDHCADESGTLTLEAARIVALADSYTEFSPSGTGVHVIVRATKPGTRAKKNGVEMYDRCRYATMTGEHVEGTPLEINARQEQIDALYMEKFGKDDEPPKAQAETDEDFSKWRAVSDEEIIRRLRGDATCDALWNGNTERQGGDESKADYVLLCRLAFFTGRDAERMEKLFGESELGKRQKWTARADYRERSIRAATDATKEVWEPEARAVVSEILSAHALEIPDLPESALAGRLGEIATGVMQDFPRAFSYLALLAVASTGVSPSNGPQTNLYVATVSEEPGKGKSAALEHAKHYLGASANVTPLKAASAEGLLADLCEQRQDEPVLVNVDELTQLLAKAQITNATMGAHLNSLFYKGEARIRNAKGKAVEYRGRLSIYGGLLRASFDEAFGAATTLGLYHRFIFGVCPSRHDFLWRPPDGIVRFDLSEGRTIRAPEFTREIWDARDAIAQAEPNFDRRLFELALRVAQLCGTIDGKSRLAVDDLAPHWEFARYQHRMRFLLRPNFGRNQDGIVTQRILDFLARNPGWVRRRDLERATHIYEFGAALVERTIRALVAGCDIEVAPGPKPKSGPTPTCVRLWGEG